MGLFQHLHACTQSGLNEVLILKAAGNSRHFSELCSLFALKFYDLQENGPVPDIDTRPIQSNSKWLRMHPLNC